MEAAKYLSELWSKVKLDTRAYGVVFTAGVLLGALVF